MGLSITFKAGVELLRWQCEAIAQWSEHLQLKREALGFSFSSWLINVDGMKDLYSALVQLSCYQHRYK